MATLIELSVQIVTTQAATSPMSTEDVLTALTTIHTRLKQLESGTTPTAEAVAEEKQVPALRVKDAFKKHEVICMVCGKGGFKTLTRHLSTVHALKPGEYKKLHGIPAKQSLSAKSYSESRRQMAIDRGLGDNLAKARQARMEKLEAKRNPPTKAKATAAVPQSSPVAQPVAAKAVKTKKTPTKAKAV